MARGKRSPKRDDDRWKVIEGHIDELTRGVSPEELREVADQLESKAEGMRMLAGEQEREAEEAEERGGE